VHSAILFESEFNTILEKTDSIYLTEAELLQLLEIKEFDNAEQELVLVVFAIGCFSVIRFYDYSTIDPL
jgi:hypothetical protein